MKKFTLLYVASALKNCIEDFDTSIKLCGQHANDEKSNAEARKYFSDQIQTYKDCRDEVLDLLTKLLEEK